MQIRFLVLGVAIAVLVIGAVIWFRQSSSVPEEPTVVPESVPVPEPAPAVTEPSPSPVVPAMPAPEPLPALNDSDARVRAELAAASPTLGPWLDREDLVRRFAVVVDNASRGDYPRRQLGFLAPSGAFPVRIEDERMFVDPAGHQRFDAFVDAATSVDAEQAAVVLEELAPLVAEALTELGVTGSSPRELMMAGIDQVLATPVLTGEVELVQSSVLYEYLDPDLEALPPLQKQLLRMGPDNLERLKTYLTAVRTALTD